MPATDLQPDPLIPILKSESFEPHERVERVCTDISNIHAGRVQAFIYYGSSLRDLNNPEKMLDFYVLVDSYRKTHKNPIRAFLNWLIPPAVYYHEMTHPDGVLTTCKYSILSLTEFERKCTRRAFLSQVWGRFSQPCLLLFPVSGRIAERVYMARANAVRYIASQTAPLFDAPADALAFWSRAMRESYQTELRPEKSGDRSREIVGRYSERYEAISRALFEKSQDGYILPPSSPLHRFRCRLRWTARRIAGKPIGAIRVLNSAATFSGGLDYILRKVKNHSGVTIAVTESQRKHPILWSPVLAFKLYRKGAFR